MDYSKHEIMNHMWTTLYHKEKWKIKISGAANPTTPPFFIIKSLIGHPKLNPNYILCFFNNNLLIHLPFLLAHASHPQCFLLFTNYLLLRFWLQLHLTKFAKKNSSKEFENKKINLIFFIYFLHLFIFPICMSTMNLKIFKFLNIFL